VEAFLTEEVVEDEVQSPHVSLELDAAVVVVFLTGAVVVVVVEAQSSQVPLAAEVVDLVETVEVVVVFLTGAVEVVVETQSAQVLETDELDSAGMAPAAATAAKAATETAVTFILIELVGCFWIRKTGGL
jgi:intracellular sulfur oxidation DsrE/DsrF family protein